MLVMKKILHFSLRNILNGMDYNYLNKKKAGYTYIGILFSFYKNIRKYIVNKTWFIF